MGKSKVGERYSVSIELAQAGTGESKENVLYNDASLQVFELSVPMNALPTGRATIVSDAANVGNPGSGSYGKLMFSGLTLDGKMMEIPIYVNTLNVYEILNAGKVILTKAALEKAEEVYA